MANTIKLKRSAVANKVPVTTDLELGEIALNTYDGKAYMLKDDGTQTVVQIGGGAGSGDVVGPASATDNAITRYDGTTGKLIQNSTVTLDDNGNIVNANSIGFDTTPATVPTADGTMSWDDGDGVPSVQLKGGNTTLQVGTQEYARVYNDSGATLTKGQVVYISGAQGNRVAVKLAKADVEATSFGTIGLVAETITNGAEGFIIVSGALYKLNTTGLTAGATVYLSPTTAGAYTTTKPQAPDQLVVIGWVERISATVGSIYVKIDNGYEIDELHDVQITSPASGNILIYDASTTPIGVWKNANLTDGTGISITEGAGSITVANSGVLGVTATSPVASTGGQNPVISMPAATTSVSGYLTSTDWNTFNNKTSNTGTVTSVAGTGSYGGLTLSGTVTTSGNITLGGTPTGTWPISVSGNAATATNSTQLGGNAAANFVQGQGSRGRSTQISDANSLTLPSGFYYGNNVTGMPTTDWWNWSQTIGDSWSAPDGYGYQLTTSFWSNDFRIRRLQTGIWQSWAKVCVDLPTQMIYDTFTANGSTTSFSTSVAYTSGKIEVYCNGVKMRNGSDVTVTSGTAVVFASAPANTSLIDLVYPI